MEAESLYRALQQHLDRMPIGFPATESGVEIRILKRLFTPEEAETALALSAIPEPPAAIQKRLASPMTVEELTAALDRMERKGTVLHFSRGGQHYYGKLMFVVGMYERQVERLTAEFERDTRQYMEEGFSDAFLAGGKRQMRIVPVNRAVDVTRNVGNYEDIRGYVQSLPGPFAKGVCICRHGKDLTGESCRQTSLRENCLTFGRAAEWMSEFCGSKLIEKEEMLALLDEADREGLVLQPENTQNPLFVCCCCHCCCGVLTGAKREARPAEHFHSNYFASIDQEKCQSCGTCVERCQMEAIRTNGHTEVDLDRCIGCGLCATTCPSEAMQMVAKEAQHKPPVATQQLYLQIMKERFGTLGMVGIGARKVLGLKV